MNGGGSGLGLSIAKWAVEASHGQLAYERIAGGGSRFRITLPLASAAPAGEPEAKVPQSSTSDASRGGLAPTSLGQHRG